MKILLLTNAYPPEIGGASNLCLELAQALTAKGHSVTVVSRFPRHLPEGLPLDFSGKWLIKESRPEALLIRINIPRLPHWFPFSREMDYILHILFLFAAAFASNPADVILTSSPPLIMGYAAVLLRLFKRGKVVVLNVQDLFPQNLIDLGVMKNKFMIWLGRLLEKDIYRRADWLTVMSEGNKEIVGNTAGSMEHISIVPNWVDSDYIVPGIRDNAFRKEFGLEDKFLLSFAGCMADSQDMAIILDSAKALEDTNELLFLLAGNGPKYEEVVNKVKTRGIGNVRIIPVQPREKYVEMLAASDVGMVTLNPKVATPTVPSKIKSIMAAGRAVLASFPLEGDAPKLIKEAACGIVVKAGDGEAFCKAIMELYQNPSLREEYGQNGRAYVMANLSSNSAAKTYENLFAKVLKERGI